ncbi:MAG: caspase family protein [Pseudomonadota bacterium]
MMKTGPQTQRIVASLIVLFAGILLLASSAVAQTLGAEDDNSEPQLYLDLPLSYFNSRSSTSADGSIYVTAGAANHITIWNIDAPGNPKIFRLPLSPEHYEPLTAKSIAVSPAAKNIIAVGLPRRLGNDGSVLEDSATVLIIDWQTEHILFELGGLPTLALDVQFSSDGGLLAAALRDGFGVRIWNTKNWTQVFSDNELIINPLTDAPADTVGVAFNPDETSDVFVGAAGAGGLRFFDRELVPIPARDEALEISNFDDIAFSPSGDFIAVGLSADPLFELVNDGPGDAFDIPLYIASAQDPYSLRKVTVPSQLSSSCDEQHLDRLAWTPSRNGVETVYAAGWFDVFSEDVQLVDCADGNYPKPEPGFAAWDVSASSGGDMKISEARLGRIPGEHTFEIVDLQALSNLGVAFLTARNYWGGFAPDGATLKYRNTEHDIVHSGIGINFQTYGNSDRLQDFLISEDGRTLLFHPFEQQERQIVLDADSLMIELNNGARDKEEFLRTLKVLPDMAVKNRRTDTLGDRPEIGDMALTLRESEKSRAIAFLRNANSPQDYEFVWATTGRIARMNAVNEVLWQTPTYVEAERLNINSDNSLLVAAHSDGVIRWYDLEDGRLLLNVFLSENLDDWIFWTPEGYFYATPRFSKFLNWKFKNDLDNSYSGRSVNGYTEFYCKALIPLILRDRDIERSIENAVEQCPELRGAAIDLRLNVPPQVVITSPLPGDEINESLLDGDRQLQINFKMRYADNAAPTPVEGATFSVGTGRPQVVMGPFTSGQTYSAKIKIDEAAISRDAAIRVTSAPFASLPNTDGAGVRGDRIPLNSQSQTAYEWTGRDSREELKDRNIYIFASGISNYPSNPLSHAHHDAEDFVNFWRKESRQSDKLFDKLTVFDIIAAPEDAAEKANRLQTEIRYKEFLNDAVSSARERDLVMVYLSGHGVTFSNNEYGYLTTDSQILDVGAVNLLEAHFFFDLLSTTKSQNVFVFVDTCRTAVSDHKFDIYRLTYSIQEYLGAGRAHIWISSRGEKSYEHISLNPEPDRGNGLFTAALISGLEGDADGYDAGRKDNNVEALELQSWVEDLWDRALLDDAARSDKIWTRYNNFRDRQQPYVVNPGPDDFPVFVTLTAGQ